MNRRAFTLIEMLIVVAIVAILAGLAVATPKGDEREGQVRAAAYELASVMRSTRAMAMETRGHYAVTFNIENPPGASGLVLSNRSGGHWYRVIGPRSDIQGNYSALPGAGFPPLYSRDDSALNGATCLFQDHNTGDSPLRHQLEAVEKSWIGDRRQLPQGKVRFIALNDQDNGDYRDNCTNWEWGAVNKIGDTFAPTYPRPWFGWWESGNKRLHTWGGYDPQRPMTTQTGPNAYLNKPRSIAGRTISHTGFFYEGYDGDSTGIVGCVQRTDRLLFDDLDGNGLISGATELAAPTYPLWKIGDPRPLINARWQDYLIVFRPDGTVYTDWMGMRRAMTIECTSTTYRFFDPSLSGTAVVLTAPAGRSHLMQLGPGDMCNRGAIPGTNPSSYLTEATSFASRSGYHFITLGPDTDPASSEFPSAEAALRSLQPMYRVGVSPFGGVVVVKVGSAKPSGKTYDTALTGSKWNTVTETDKYYRDNMLVNQVSGKPSFKPRGSPITDVVTPEMLSNRMWWWQ